MNFFVYFVNKFTGLNLVADILLCVCRKLNEDDSIRGGVKSVRMKSESKEKKQVP